MKKIIILLVILFQLKSADCQNLPFNPILKPFYHGVASGDPLEDRVILWTRVTPDYDTIIHGQYIVARDTQLTELVITGNFTTDAHSDYTVKVDVIGLQPGQTYFYAFIALGARSAIGRTKTAPSIRQDNLESTLKFGIISCTNYEGGYFNACKTLAKRNDLDAVIHLGDYIYEYEPGKYRNKFLTDQNRSNLPAKELVELGDYRLRYSLYRLDPDMQRLHQQHPLIAIWDDHEFANDAYATGAENHQASEGDWEQRKSEARKAYFEWMPVRQPAPPSTIYRKFSYGQLMDLFMLDTRMDERQQPPPNFDTPDDSLKPRQIMSQTQWSWLINELRTSKAKWKAIGNQIILSDLNVGFAAVNPTDYDQVAAYENLFRESWEGYLLMRNRLIDSIKINKMNNVVFLSGDSHCSWAFDVTSKPVLYPLPQFGYLPQPNPYDPLTGQGYNPESGEGSVAVEFCSPSISAANFAEELGSDSVAAIFEYFINKPIPLLPGSPNYNPHLKLVDFDRHGYMIFDVRKDSVQADFFFVPNVYEKQYTESFGLAASSLSQSGRITNANVLQASLPKPIQDIPAPVIVGTEIPLAEVSILSVYPNPAQNEVYVLVGALPNLHWNIDMISANGIPVHPSYQTLDENRGIIKISDLDSEDFLPGIYLIRLYSKNQIVTRKVCIK